MKKIAIICDYLLMPERIGGMDRFFWQFDKECKQNNIEVDWFFPNSKIHSYYQEMNVKLPLYMKKANLDSYFLGYIKQHNSNYDVVMTHFVELCSSFSKKLKKKLPHTELIAIDHNPRPINGYSIKKKIIKRIKGILYSKYTNQFIGVSQYTVNEILKDFGKHLKPKTKVLYNGIEINKYIERQNRNHQKPSFLVACHLRESKGIQDLIEAINLLNPETKDKIKIDIFGDGPFKSQLQKLISDYKLDNNFVFKGNVGNLYEIYHQYDYLIHPSHMECFSLGLLESLVSNVPVITTNVGGNEEVVVTNKNGFIFQAKDVKALSQIIFDIVSGYIKIEGNTRALIESNFSIEKMVNQYLKLIK